MESEKKNKLKNILIWVGLGALIAFVIITSIALHAKDKKYQELKDKNDSIEPQQGQEIIRIME